jgi:signal transduction histidine kinase
VIAEDEKRLLESLRYLFQRKGYDVLTAENGKDALDILNGQREQGRRVDLLITDVEMPGMRGEDLVRAVASSADAPKIMVITAHGEKELVTRLMRLGCHDFIDKPFAPAQLEARVEQLLRESKLSQTQEHRQVQLAVLNDRTRLLIHDLNNLLCQTLGHAESALRKIEETHPVQQKLKKLVAAAQASAQIADRLMALKAEGKKVLRSKVDLRVVVHEMAGVLRAIASDAVKLNVDSPDHPVWADIEVDRIRQAILNLGINAIDAMPGGGSLTLAAVMESRNGADGSQTVLRPCISVADEGHGIPEAHLARLFDEAFTTKANGHGYGLLAVRTIVQENGGRVDVKSTVGTGTCFKMSFPEVRK